MTILELLAREDLQIRQQELPAERARAADEVFITSTAGGVMPVTRIDGAQVGDGIPGDLTSKLNDAYWALHDDPGYNIEVDY